MLTKFAVTNYRGFKERIELDLTTQSSYSFNDFAVRDGIIKDALLFGANGSGKTSLGLALFDITRQLPYNTNRLPASGRPSLSGTTIFEYSFLLGGMKVDYIYTLERDEKHFYVSERFFEDDELAAKSSHYYTITDADRKMRRRYDDEYYSEDYPVTEAEKNSFLINTEVMKEVKDFVSSMLWCSSNDNYDWEEYILIWSLQEELANFLEKTSGQVFSFSCAVVGARELLCLVDDKLVPFSTIASKGTKELCKAYCCLRRAAGASFAFIDDFANNMHFRTAGEVCKRFLHLNTQLILTTHNTYLMSNEVLRPDCIFLTDGKKTAPLCKWTNKELRWGHNLEKLYRGGAFK